MVNAAAMAGSAIRVGAGQFLFGPDRRADGLYLITYGLFRLIEPPGAGRRVLRTLAWLGPGEVIGWDALLPRRPGRLWVQAERESRIVRLPLRMLARRVIRQPRLAIEIIAQLAGHLAAAYVEAGELTRLETPARLAHCLRRLADHPVLAQRDERWSIIRLTHADLASRTGISRETVSLILSRWRRMGLVRTGRGRLMVDRNRLDEWIAQAHAAAR